MRDVEHGCERVGERARERERAWESGRRVRRVPRWGSGGVSCTRGLGRMGAPMPWAGVGAGDVWGLCGG